MNAQKITSLFVLDDGARFRSASSISTIACARGWHEVARARRDRAAARRLASAVRRTALQPLRLSDQARAAGGRVRAAAADRRLAAPRRARSRRCICRRRASISARRATCTWRTRALPASTASNRPFTITAVMARQKPDLDGLVTLDKPKGDLTTTAGNWLELSANTGLYQQQPQLLDLFGQVALYPGQGQRVPLLPRAHIDMAAGTAEGDDPMTGQGPFGNVTADGFRILDRGDTIIFKGHATLDIEPRGDAGPREDCAASRGPGSRRRGQRANPVPGASGDGTRRRQQQADRHRGPERHRVAAEQPRLYRPRQRHRDARRRQGQGRHALWRITAPPTQRRPPQPSQARKPDPLTGSSSTRDRPASRRTVTLSSPTPARP